METPVEQESANSLHVNKVSLQGRKKMQKVVHVIPYEKKDEDVHQTQKAFRGSPGKRSEPEQ